MSVVQLTTTHSSAWSAFLKTVSTFDRHKISTSIALRNTLAVAIPLAAGVAAGSIAGGLIVAIGALNVSFADSHDPYPQRARKMLTSSLLVGLGVFAGALSGSNAVAAVAIAATWAYAAGMMVALSTAAADLGVTSLVTLVVFASRPLDLKAAFFSGLLAVAGGLLQTLLAVAMWPVRRYAAEQRALADLYLELARVSESPLKPLEAPPASAQSTAAQHSLATLAGDHSTEAERFLLLLSQAERMRIGLMVLMRIRTRIERETPDSQAAEILRRYFAVCSEVLRATGNSLSRGAETRPAARPELHELAEEMRALPGAMAADARFQMDALNGQLRSALELTSGATPEGRAAFESAEARRPWRLRLAGNIATLRANLRLDSAACRHALRIAVCVALGDALGRALDLHRAYWIPMTVAIVLKPDFKATFSRGTLRLAGTYIGLLIATGLFHAVHTSATSDVVLIAAFMFLLRCFGPANYGVLVTMVTGLVVVLLAMTGVSPKDVIGARGINTSIGGAIALLAYLFWPTWERTQVGEAIARMLDAYREYFRLVSQAYTHLANGADPALDNARLAGRLARSNLEASVDRLSGEPGVSAAAVSKLNAMLASSHRLAHAFMALEAGSLQSPTVPVRQEFGKFSKDVELTLYYLGAALRGSPISRADLPDLREDHHVLLQAADPAQERYALTNIETDRVTNSLNTVAEQVLDWVSIPQ